MAQIVVVGSSNTDLIAYTPKMPKIGETLKGSEFKIGFGGKGANQAVTSAKLGGKVAMVTKLGDDSFGKDTVQNFKNFGINQDGIFVTNKAASGVAIITVDPSGHNSIIIVPGANDLLSIEDVNHAKSVITSAKILLTQLEISTTTTLHALKLARAAAVTTIFNPAPAVADLPKEIFENSDYVCPNETELEILTGASQPPQSVDEAVIGARKLLHLGAKNVIVTLGDKGSVLVTNDSHLHIPAVRVKPVDTTGAGDCYLGSFAYFLANGYSVEESMRCAAEVAAVSVTKQGTQTSYPTRAELPSKLFEHKK